MARYVACGWDDQSCNIEDRGPLIERCEVDGPARVDTGLVTVHGKPIMRLADPIGFGRDKERG